jgi:hypothetical protein
MPDPYCPDCLIPLCPCSGTTQGRVTDGVREIRTSRQWWCPKCRAAFLGAVEMNGRNDA